ncbi:MAG: nucleotidyltransferase family protein [Deltaproteobacteria bacterium]|nr:nucleotidyltransferase family protein [Deltaproteobacteria bacterium]
MHGVEMLFYFQLKKHYAGRDASIDDYLERKKHPYLQGIAASMRQEAVENEVVGVLDRQGIPACIIKGNEIARSLYGDPNCRCSSDIDVLVKKEDFFKADSILQAARYVPIDKVPLAYFMYYDHHAKYHDPTTKNIIEVHWTCGLPGFFGLSPEEIWEEVGVESDGRLTLLPEMLMITLLINHHIHSFRELRIIVDLLWAFHKYDRSIHWPEFAVRLKRLGLIKTTLIAISQIEDLWPGGVSRMQSIREVKQSMMGMGYKTPNFLASYFRMNINKTSETNPYVNMFFARFALDHLRTTFRSYLRNLFPPPEVIRELYHPAGWWMLPIGYLRYIVWKVKVWTGWRKRYGVGKSLNF